MAKHNPILNAQDLNAICEEMATMKVVRNNQEVTMAEAAASSKQWQDEHPRRESLQKGDKVIIAAGSVARPASFTDNNGATTNYFGITATVVRGGESFPLTISFGALTKPTFALGAKDEMVGRRDRLARFGKVYPWHYHAHEQTIGDQTRVTQLQVLDENVEVVLSEESDVRVCGAYDESAKAYRISRKVDTFAYAPAKA